MSKSRKLKAKALREQGLSYKEIGKHLGGVSAGRAANLVREGGWEHDKEAEWKAILARGDMTAAEFIDYCLPCCGLWNLAHGVLRSTPVETLCDLSESDLMTVKHVGEVSVQQLKDGLAKHGMHMRDVPQTLPGLAAALILQMNHRMKHRWGEYYKKEWDQDIKAEDHTVHFREDAWYVGTLEQGIEILEMLRHGVYTTKVLHFVKKWPKNGLNDQTTIVDYLC